jgi:hypothetical protein
MPTPKIPILSLVRRSDYSNSPILPPQPTTDTLVIHHPIRRRKRNSSIIFVNNLAVKVPSDSLTSSNDCCCRNCPISSSRSSCRTRRGGCMRDQQHEWDSATIRGSDDDDNDNSFNDCDIPYRKRISLVATVYCPIPCYQKRISKFLSTVLRCVVNFLIILMISPNSWMLRRQVTAWPSSFHRLQPPPHQLSSMKLSMSLDSRELRFFRRYNGATSSSSFPTISSAPISSTSVATTTSVKRSEGNNLSDITKLLL